MDIIIPIILFVSGFLFGSGFILIIKRNESRRIDESLNTMGEVFKNLSQDALIKNQENFLQLAGSQFRQLHNQSEATLDEKKKLIDSSLVEMKNRLENLTSQTSQLKGQIAESQKGITQLSDTTSHLRRILSSNQARGSWGEKMVEDILNFMGFIEGLNYDKQKTRDSHRPDFTFKLPKEKVVNMDVKFPLSHYEQYLSLENETEKENAKKRFIADVKNHIKEIDKRGYVNPSDGTLDYVLMFIPNESIYYFIHLIDPGLMDYALSKKVVLCSPVTLYAVLSLIHQAVMNFSMEEKAGEMQKMISVFKDNWQKFVDKMDKLGNSLNAVQNHYNDLSTTRVRQLEKPVDQIIGMQIEDRNSQGE